jgi:N-acyl-D-amino-acid deacylase
MLTLAQATAWGFHDRGLIKEGFVADLAVFDPDTVGPEMPTITNDLPGGAKRLSQRATGFLATVVGGSVFLRNGEHTGALSGQLIRGPLARQ